MRILIVSPGANTSTSDVHRGLVAGLRHLPGLELAHYELGGRIAVEGAVLDWMYRRAKRTVPDCMPPSPTDVLLRASRDVLYAAWKHQADWVLFVSGMFVHPDILATLRWYGKTKIGLLLTESPYDDDRQIPVAKLADVCWTNERVSVPVLREACPDTYYLRHAYNPTLHAPADGDPAVPAHDVVFVGTLFQERIEMLEAVDWAGLGIDFGLYGQVEYLGPRHRLRKFVRGHQIENDYAVELYRRAKLGLNLYRQSMGWGKDAQRITTAESLNPRAYELAACGCVTVSDWRPEVTEIFGDMVPTFRDPKELGPLLVRWLKDEAGRAAVAAQLPVAVAPHTWDARAAEMVEQMARIDAQARAA